MSKLDELKQEIARLEAKAKEQDQPASTPVALPDGANHIPDDDPELMPLMKGCDDPEVQKVWPDLARAKTLTEAKRIIARRRKDAALLAAIRDESLPTLKRIGAAQEWKAATPRGGRWDQVPEEELLEMLSLHPYALRLKELHDFIYDRSPIESQDIIETANAKIAAIKEFEALRVQYPKRESCVVLDPEQKIRYWTEVMGEPEHAMRWLPLLGYPAPTGWSHDLYDFAKALQGRSSEAKAAPEPESTDLKKVQAIDLRKVEAHYDHLLEQLNAEQG